jgi:N-formylmaleamate deformylase
MKTLLIALALATGLGAQQPIQVQVTGHGQPMILIPGYSCPGEVWDGTVARYKDHYQVHAVSLAGFAGLPRVPGPFLDTAREAIAAYALKNKLDHPVIAGHSLGGFLALDIAAHYPDLAGKLVIVDSYPMLAAMMDPKSRAKRAMA